MIIGIGIDIVENVRVEKLFLKFGNRFLNKIFTKIERNDILNYKKSILRMANRFAAKEAFYKSISKKINKQFIFWRDIEVINENSGSPKLILYGRAKMFLENLVPPDHEAKIHLSLSHENLNTVAMVIIEINKK